MQAEALVDKAYRAILGRPADASGLRHYGDAIRAGTLTGDVLARLLMDSPEFKAGQKGGGEERAVINALVKFHTDLTVLAGPFAGMRMIDLSSRGDGDVSPKLLGTYETETHPAIMASIGNRYDAIVDVGCAEGYFAVGLARLFPDIPVLAYDTNAPSLEILGKLAALNGCAERIVGGAFCDPAELGRVLTLYPRCFVIVDCEGYEKTLFADPATNALTAASDMIIECHDLWDRTITPTLVAALTPTHAVEVVTACGRNPNLYDFLAHMTDWDRFRAVWERRGARQNWLVCRARTPGGAGGPVPG